MSEDQRTPNSVPSLVKLAYNAFSEEQREVYRTEYRTLPEVDLRQCCEALFLIIKINSVDGTFDQHGDRRLMYNKIQATFGINIFSTDVCKAAVFWGHVDCLKLAKEMGCPFTSLTFLHAIVQPYNMECVIFLHENGCEWNTETCEVIAYLGNLAYLKYANQNGCPWNEATCAAAAKAGKLDCLAYAHEHGCPWNEMTCAAAAMDGQLDCLVYAHEHGCPWNEMTCAAAAKNGHVECLAYAHEHGCPWNEMTCATAAMAGELDCLVYAHEHGCPWNEETSRNALHFGNISCFVYAFQHGCPREDSDGSDN